MSKWFWKVTADPEDLLPLVDFITHFETEYELARKDVAISGSIEMLAGRLPGMVEYRYGQLQEIEAILKWLEEQHKKTKGQMLRKYTEKYNRALSPTVAEKYADSDPEVIDKMILINQVALVRNKFLGIMKGMEYKHFQLSNIVKLRCAGLEDSEINYKR